MGLAADTGPGVGVWSSKQGDQGVWDRRGILRGKVVVTLALGLVLCSVRVTEGFPQCPAQSAFLSNKPKARLERSLVNLTGPSSHLL